MNLKSNDPNYSFASTICSAMVASLSRVCNTAWTLSGIEEMEHQAPRTHVSEDFCLSFAEPLNGKCILSVQNDESADESGEKHDGTAAVHSMGGPLLEALHATVEALKNSLAPAHKRMNIEVQKVTAGEQPGGPTVTFNARFYGEESQLVVGVVLDAALAASLQMVEHHALFSVSVASPQSQANLDLVMDVALNVTLRFGRRQLPLREIIDLTSGSVVELDRQVDEPVELVLDGRVVARGEAVVIDGNYGMRVTQIVHPLLNV